MSTLLHYRLNEAGKSHLACGIPCQDACSLIFPSSFHAVALIADGVGACTYAGEAAQLAVSSASKSIEEHFPLFFQDVDILSALRCAMHRAYLESVRFCSVRRLPLEEFETTLTIVCYDGVHVYFAHSGDGGVLGLRPDGGYTVLTKRQKGTSFCEVYPLSAGPWFWQIEKAEGEFASVLTATDGIFDVLCPPGMERSNPESQVYTLLLQELMDQSRLRLNRFNIGRMERRIRKFFLSGQADQISDDKTMLVLVNPSVHPRRRSKEYYREPDWSVGSEEEII